MAIFFDPCAKIFTIETKNTAYQMKIDKYGYLLHLYYGEKIKQNMDYLRLCRKTGLQAAEFYGWTIINCEKNGRMRSIEDIHNEIFNLVQTCLED